MSQNLPTKRQLTKYYPSLIPKERADACYLYLKENTPWIDGIYSKKDKKITRKAYQLDDTSSIHDSIISELIEFCLDKLMIKDNFVTLGAYVNYYRDGNDWAPSHSHQKQIQLIISLGATRKLVVGNKTYVLNNGDVIIFGSSIHSVPLEPDQKESRISIATFMVPKMEVNLTDETVSRLLAVLEL